ncbi:MAG: ABC transporter substrate-binding protein [bacterium]|nr:ABC transporter substrate-binding protein [bacterium]
MNFRFKLRARYWFRLAAAMVTKYYLIIALGIALGAGSFFALPKLAKWIPKWRSANTIAVVGRYATSDIPLSIQRQISQGLTTLDPSGIPTGSIATSWTVSSDGKVYTFEIDPHLKWQDGTPLVSRDINYQFRDTETEYPNDTQLVMKLKDPFAPLPVITSRPVFKRGLLGTGSYEVSRIRKNGSYIDSLTLSPADKSTSQPNLVYKFYLSEAAARLAFKLGTVRTVSDLQDLADLANWPNTEVTKVAHPDRYVAVFFNTKDPNFTGQAGHDLRLALAYAIDKSRWTDRALGPINPNSWAYLANLKPYSLDVARAKSLLTKVEKKPSEITLSTVPAYLSTAEAIKEDWEKLGLKVNILVAAEPTSDFMALVIAQAIPLDPDQYNLWHSTQATNLTGQSNPRIDKLLEDGRKVQDLEQRKTIYQDFQRFLVEEVPAIFLFHPGSYTVSRK